MVDDHSSMSGVRRGEETIPVGYRGAARFLFNLSGAPRRNESEDLFRDRTRIRTANIIRFEWSETLGPSVDVAEQ